MNLMILRSLILGFLFVAGVPNFVGCPASSSVIYTSVVNNC